MADGIRPGAEGVLGDALGERMAAMAVYAPCTLEAGIDFFLGEYLEAVQAGPTECMVVGGDYNCAMRVEDVLAATRSGQRPLAG